jgi:hypothetical protein
MAATQDAPQYLQALDAANRVRLARAALKHEIATGQRTVADVLADVPPEAETMTIVKLLMAQHRWARTRARRLLLAANIGEAKPVGELTERQRGVLIGMLHTRQITGRKDALSIECPFCQAPPGEPCRKVRRPTPWRLVVLDEVKSRPHSERRP